MEEELQDVVEQDSSPVDESVGSSPQEDEEVQDSSPEEKQAPFHEHPRFKEVIEEKNYWKDMAMKLADKPQQTVEKSPDKDPYEGLTAEEKMFWEQIDKRAEGIAGKKIGKLQEELQQYKDFVQKYIGNTEVEKFRNKYPDVEANSPEEKEIIQRISKGYSVPDAYESVMGPKLREKLRREADARKKQKTQQKVAANLETSGIPSQTPVKAGEKPSVRDFVHQLMAKGQGAG